MISTTKLLNTIGVDPDLFEIYFKDEYTPYLSSMICWGRQLHPNDIKEEKTVLWEAIEMFRNNIELHQEELEKLEKFYFQFYGGEE